MNKLQEYIYNNINFDEHNDKNGDDFNGVLFEELERLTTWNADCIDFFNLDYAEILKLASRRAGIDTRTDDLADRNTPTKNIKYFNYIGGTEKPITIDDIVYTAMEVIAFEQIYTELQEKYLKEYREG